MDATAITTSATLSLCSSFSSQCRLFSTRSQSTLLSLPKPLVAAATSLFSTTRPCLPPLRVSSSVIEFEPEAPPVGAEAEVSVDEPPASNPKRRVKAVHCDSGAVYYYPVA